MLNISFVLSFGDIGCSIFLSTLIILTQMYRDEYFPNFWVDKIKAEAQKLAGLLESGETGTNVILEKPDEITCTINDL